MKGANRFWDSRNGYGLVSRSLHWLMAFLFLLQFTSAILRVFAKDTAAYHFLWPAHHEIGFALLVLVLLRGFWGLANIAHRPRVIGWLGRLAGPRSL